MRAFSSFGIFVLALAAALWSRSALAHPVGLSQGVYAYQNGKVLAGLTFSRRELADSNALPGLKGGDGAESPLAFERQRERIGRWLLARTIASGKGEPCTGSFDGMRFDGDGVSFALSFTCPVNPKELTIDARFVSDLDRGHRHAAKWVLGDDEREGVATASGTRLSFGESAPTPDGTSGEGERATSSGTFVPFLRMGVEHILTGYDHLLFLFGLLLVGGPIRSLVLAATSFTLAHSITLAVAALGWWTPNARIVEPLIALSLVYVGVENWFVRDARGRWRVTFAFGLVHGFGFAGALRDIALPRSEIASALFAFNLGVEVGQIGMLAIVLPLVLAAQKRPAWERVGMRACTMTVVLAGTIWFVARVRGSM